MELNEVFMMQFTTATTCYSGSRRLPLRFATENHILTAIIEADGSVQPETHSVIPRDNASVICVGFSQYNVGTDGEQSEPVYALCLVDPACIEQPEEAIPTLYQPNAVIDGRDDSMSLTSNAISISEAASSTRGHRGMTGTAASSASASVSNSSTSTPLRGSKPDQLSSSMEIRDLDASQRGPSVQLPKGRLILQMEEEFVALLEFRPLSPCVASWGEDVVGVWVGSADDSQLRFFEPNRTNKILESRLDLPEEYFGMDSPVMGIDFHSSDDLHTVAVACQDGTIRIISWKGKDGFHELSRYELVIDGPLVSLQFQPLPCGDLRILIGSLCGYACHLVRKASSSTWERPIMVEQGLWNETIQSEDSVLAVHGFGDCVAIGTLSGRCLVYQANYSGKKYYKLWECVLPYSVHGIVALNSSPVKLAVTTRRSFHILENQNQEFNVLSSSENRYSVDVAKARLAALLQEPEEPKVQKEQPKMEADQESTHLSDADSTVLSVSSGEPVITSMPESTMVPPTVPVDISEETMVAMTTVESTLAAGDYANKNTIADEGTAISSDSTSEESPQEGMTDQPTHCEEPTQDPDSASRSNPATAVDTTDEAGTEEAHAQVSGEEGSDLAANANTIDPPSGSDGASTQETCEAAESQTSPPATKGQADELVDNLDVVPPVSKKS